MKRIGLWLSIAFAVVGFVVSNLIDPNGYLPFSIDLFLAGVSAVLGFAIGMIIKQKKEKEEEARRKTEYEGHVKLAEFYLKCVKSGYTDYKNADNVGKEKINLFARDLSYFYRGSEKSIMNAFDQGKELADKLGEEIFLHVRQNASDEKPDKWAILRARRPIDSGISDDTLLALYRHGEKCVITVDVVRKSEEEERRTLDSFVHQTGRDKRLAMLTKQARELAQKVDSHAFLSDNWGQKKESDWAIAGGISSAIGGVGAGVAAAMNTQMKNLEIRAHNAQMSQLVNAVNNETYLRQVREKERLQSLRNEIEETKGKLVEEENDHEQLMSMLNIKCKQISLTETGAAHITTGISLSGKDDLFIREGKVPAVIDGVICAKLMEGGRCKGKAYLTLPLYGIGISHYEAEVKGFCTTVRNPSAEYQLAFEPHHLWLMER